MTSIASFLRLEASIISLIELPLGRPESLMQVGLNSIIWVLLDSIVEWFKDEEIQELLATTSFFVRAGSTTGVESCTLPLILSIA